MRFGLRAVTKATNGGEEKCFWDCQTTFRSVNYFVFLSLRNTFKYVI